MQSHNIFMTIFNEKSTSSFRSLSESEASSYSDADEFYKVGRTKR